MARMPPAIVYFDYLCPYAYRVAEATELVGDALDLEFDWRHFSAYQARQAEPEAWQLWNERLDPGDASGCRGLLPFLASVAARRQGREAFDRFRLGLLRARHQELRSYDEGTIRAVAAGAGLHMARFERDLSDPEARTELAHEHCAASRAEVHATPTVVFPEGHTAWLRIKALPADRDEAVRLFASLQELLSAYPYLETVTRPRARHN